MPYKFNPFTGTLDEVGTGGGGGTTNLDGLTDVTIAAPSDWEVLGYNATSGLWENTSHIHASVAGNLYVHIKNTDSVQLDKGTPFYITGTVGASDQVEVQAADNTDPTKGPAIGLVEDNLPINAEGNGVLIGEIYNYDTATPGWSTNDALYVSAAGAITNAQPASGYRQIVGYVGRVHASTGTIVVLGNQKDPVAGSDTEIQFNDNGGFGASADLTWDDTNKELGVGGDINLDDGGTFSTTVQSVTPTANRTISFPDATGTVALVSGSNGTIQYNDAGTLKGNSDFTVNVDWDSPSTTFTALKVNVPDILQGAADSKLLDLQAGGTSKCNVSSSGKLQTNSGLGDIETGISLAASDYRVNINGLYVVEYGLTYLANNANPGYRQWLFEPGTGFALNQYAYFGWSDQNFNVHASNFDVRLWRDDAGILAQRNGTASQTFRLYNTWGNNGADFERTSLTRDATGLVIDAQKGGTGADPTNLLDLQLGGASRFSVLSTGKLSLKADPAASVNVAEITLTSGNGNFGSISSGGGGEIYVQGTYNRNIFGTRLGNGNSYGWSPTPLASQLADTALARDSAGVVKITDGGAGTGYVKQTPVLVSALPAAATVGAGTRGFVSDATATTFASVVTGSGTASTAGTVPVYSDGTDWRIG